MTIVNIKKTLSKKSYLEPSTITSKEYYNYLDIFSYNKANISNSEKFLLDFGLANPNNATDAAVKSIYYYRLTN